MGVLIERALLVPALCVACAPVVTTAAVPVVSPVPRLTAVPAPSSTASPRAPATIDPNVPAWIQPELASLELTPADNAFPLDLRRFASAPHIVISRQRVLLDGQVVISVSEITDRREPTRVDRLFGLLKARREQWVKAHPDDYFSGDIFYWVDARAVTVAVKSVFQTAAFAGYDRGAFIARRRSAPTQYGWLPADAQVPKPNDESAPVRTGSAGGRLPPEVIQAIVRQSYGVFRKCYEAGLLRSPTLEGKVLVRFTIDKEGHVSDAQGAGSTLPDDQVLRCIIDAYRKLTFPAPEGGIVKVVYPIMFSPGQ